MKKEKRTWNRILSILLIFQIIVASSLAIFALYDFPSLAEQFGFAYQSDMGILRLIVVYNLCLSACICLWSVLWIRRENIAGIQAGTTVGFLIFVVSFIVFLQYNRVDMLLFDSLRAFLMVIFGVLAYRAQNKEIKQA